ncbi:MAG: tyrosinase family protein [Azospirillaceae bacterium]
MSLNALSRRDLLKGGVGLSAVTMLVATGGCEQIVEQIRTRPVRKSVTSPDAAGDIAIYNDAVAAMRALPSSDPRNWNAQAQIHFDFCPHGNWYFLPWHRAYLFYFEQICRTLTGEPEFALPYWNWQADRAIPAPFWTGDLNFSPRSATPSSMASTSAVGQSVMEGIFQLTNFEQFASYASTALRGGTGGGYGELEGTPHNYIHGFVGGTMATFQSPRDPVFWCHHNMIDCSWAHWNIARGNVNTDDPQWTQFDLAGMFVDGDGDPASMTCGLTVILPLISYAFQPSPKGDMNAAGAGGGAGAMAEADRDRLREMLEAGGNIRHQVRERFAAAEGVSFAQLRTVSRPIRVPQAALARATAEGAQESRLLLQLGDVTPPATNDAFVRVFVNKPDATPDTPIDDPHYAGSFAFFFDSEMRGRMPEMTTPDYYVDVTDTVRDLRQAGMLSDGDSVELTLVATPFEGRTPQAVSNAIRPLSVGRLDLVTTPTAIKGQ